jgi:antitoxin component YwqK of YwqJK toxin-antitoxin module
MTQKVIWTSVILLSLVLTSCNARLNRSSKKGSKVGTWVTYVDSTKQIQITRYRNEVQHGKYKALTPSGGNIVRGKYKCGKKHGIWKYYLENGSIHKTIKYDHDSIIEVTILSNIPF